MGFAMLNPSHDVKPLSQAEFAAALSLIGGFENRPTLAVAVSGGPDSLALMLLADRWARERGGKAWGLTVDHGLRPESAAEARQVGDWLAARGIPQAILEWTGDKPRSGVQAAAREARYRLLAAWCRDHGVLHLMTAHHRDDQAETHLIRRRAGSGIDGLAGMSAVRELPGCRLVRPLLAVPHARLAALLAVEGQPFLTDPSNRNPLFERARLRHAALDVDSVIAQTRAYAAERIPRERALYAFLAEAVALHPAGFAVLETAALEAADPDLGERVLGRIAACIGGMPYPARHERLARLRAALTAHPQRPRTLGGCRFVPWRERILVLRELAAAAPPAPLEPGHSLTWDRRFSVRVGAAAPRGLMLGYLGADRIADGDGGLPRLVYPVLPVLRDAAGIAGVPHLGYRREDVALLPEIFFRPANALSDAGFTVV